MKKSFYILASIFLLLLSSPIFAQADPGGDPDKTIGSYTGSICAGSSYTWPANGQVYTTAQSGVTVVNGDNIATLNLTVTSTPSAGANGSLVICAGTSVDATALYGALTGTPATGGTWSATTGGAGTYTYTQAATSPCTVNNTATVTVTEQAVPASAGANGSLVICAGSSVDATALYGALTGTPAIGGTWSATTGGAGTYTYTQAATSPCTVNNTATVTVTEQAVPASAGANGSLVICAGSSVDVTALYGALTGTPATGGTWSATTGGAGTYTYTQAGTSPCGNNIATVTVTEQVLPNAGTSGTLSLASSPSDADLLAAIIGEDTGGIWSRPSSGYVGVYTYTVNATYPCTGSATSTVNVTASTQIPSSPVAYCDKKLIGDVTAGTSLKFYKDIKPTTAAYLGTDKLKAQIYYVTETVNGVESTPRVPVVVTLTALVAPTSIASTETKVICKYMGTSNLVTFTTTPVVEASTYSWTVPTGASIVTNLGTSIEVSFAGVSGAPGLIGNVTVDANNALGCPSGKPKVLALTTKSPSAAKSIALTYNGVTVKKAGNFVGDNSKILTLTATDVSGTADHHVWTLPTNTHVVSGDANNDLVITIDLGDVTASNEALVFSCASVGGCGSSSKTLSVARAEAGTPKGIMLTDDLISAITAIKKLDNYTGTLKTRPLTLTATPNATAGSEATSYKWVLPAQATTTATAIEGQANTYTSTSPSISVNLANVSTETAFVFKVYGVNGNGTSLLSKDLACTSTAPKAPSAIYRGDTGSGVVFSTYSPSCNVVTLSVPAVLGVANSFTTSTPGVSIGEVVGNAVTVDFSGAPSTAKSTVVITATATTATGTNSKAFTVKLGACAGGRITAEEVITADEFNVIAYPNPSSSEFTIDIQSSSKGATNVQVIDMVGRLIENRQVQSNSVEIGRNYASGIYNVIVNQGTKVKTLRVIKQ